MIDLGAGGRILGVLFSRGTSSLLNALPGSVLALNDPAALAVWLARECWGAYLAVLADPASGELHAFPDPSGLFPVYRRETRSHTLLASEPRLLAAAGIEPVAVSWPALHSFLCWPELRQQATCLEGVSEMEPGLVCPIGPSSRPAVPVWRPDGFLPRDGSRSFEAVTEELRALAASTIGAWAGLFGRVVVAASGGVDSSLICAALACGGLEFDCVTLATVDPSGDERGFVRLLGTHLGVRVAAVTYALDGIDPARPASLGFARPSRKTFMTALDHALLKACDELGAGVVFDGNGGDNLFCYLHSAAPFIDRLRNAGPGRAALRTFLDLCRLTGCDVRAMARAVLHRIIRPSPVGLWSADTRLLADRPRAAARPLSPWFNCDVGRHPGKRDHLALIMRGQNHVHGLTGSGPRRFSPLMSQPLVEFCLGVPTWLWCHGGINRAPARAAFACDLPREIVVRTSKSGPDSFIRRLFETNRPMIRSLLLDGLLAREAVIDRAATEAGLSTDALTGGSIIYRLLDLAEAESWARSWAG